MSLRMVEMVVAQDAAVAIEDLAESLHVMGLWQERLEGDLLLLRILMPSDRTESVLHSLEQRFSHSPDFRLVIFEVEATLPKPELDVANKAARAPEGTPAEAARIACVELVQKLATGAVVDQIFLVTVMLSTFVAAIGLVRDSIAVIIGAMVIAPLLAPNMTLALATTLGDLKLARDAMRVNLAGMGLAFVISMFIGVVAPLDPSVPEIASRTQVAMSDIALALAAGSAGALAFTTGLSASLVGVMVAVALLPPLVTVGLMLGSGHIELAGQAALLTAINVVCVNLAGVATFLWRRVGPNQWWEAKRAQRMVRMAAISWLILLALLIALIVVSHQ